MALAAKSDNLSTLAGTHRGKERTVARRLSPDLCICPHRCTHSNKKRKCKLNSVSHSRRFFCSVLLVVEMEMAPLMRKCLSTPRGCLNPQAAPKPGHAMGTYTFNTFSVTHTSALPVRGVTAEVTQLSHSVYVATGIKDSLLFRILTIFFSLSLK